MEGLRIEEHADKYSHDCSGGTKRKLSYGMAMLGKAFNFFFQKILLNIIIFLN